MKKEEYITLKWVVGGRERYKGVEKESFSKIMLGLKDGFIDNNEVSTVFCELMPNLRSISIDFDRNNQIEVPFVICKVKGQEKVVYIRRCNKIIWSLLNGYCQF